MIGSSGILVLISKVLNRNFYSGISDLISPLNCPLLVIVVAALVEAIPRDVCESLPQGGMEKVLAVACFVESEFC